MCFSVSLEEVPWRFRVVHPLPTSLGREGVFVMLKQCSQPDLPAHPDFRVFCFFRHTSNLPLLRDDSVASRDQSISAPGTLLLCCYREWDQRSRTASPFRGNQFTTHVLTFSTRDRLPVSGKEPRICQDSARIHVHTRGYVCFFPSRRTSSCSQGMNPSLRRYLLGNLMPNIGPTVLQNSPMAFPQNGVWFL